jgi:membrane protein
MTKQKNILLKIIDFLKTDIWRIRLKDLPSSKSFFIKNLRILLVALREFNEDKCQLRASALTFYSLLSIVPVMAMAFGVAKGFGFEKMLEKQLLAKFSGQQEVIAWIISFANSVLENTKGGLIAGVGVAVLFWTVIKVLGNIERSFNDIWGIKQARNLGRKFADYLSMMLFCPILVIISSSITVFITTQITTIAQKIALLGFFSPIIFTGLKLLPYAVIWALFTFIYIFMPNTKINFKSGILAGIIAGTIYQILQWGYIHFQVGVAKYNAIYGSFAALPLFLVWLQLSWLVVLLGAEISFAHQNVDTYEFEQDCLKISLNFKKVISLRIVQMLTKNFYEGIGPSTAAQISHNLDIPIRLVRQIIYELIESGIVTETKLTGFKEVAFQPGRDINSFTIQYILEALENRGINNIPVAQTKELKTIHESLKAFEEKIKKSPENILLKEI